MAFQFTFQLAKIFRLNPNIKLPFKRYQIGEVFRDEPVGASRFRQFTQCDADVAGDSSIETEIEIISMFSDILKELKISAEIEVNNRKLLNDIIDSVQIMDKKSVMKELDKMTKLGEDTVKANLKKYADSNQVMTLFKLLEKPLEFFIENAFKGSKELKDLFSLAKKYSIKLKFNPFMVRGFSYYTGNILEVINPETKLTIAAGGRYDKSIGKYIGREIPAFGMSFGLERLCELARIPIAAVPKALLISIDEDNETIKLIRKLRKESISCIKMNDKVGKCLEYANSYAIPYTIFIGRDEVQKGKFKIKDMNSGEEKSLSEAQLIKMLK